VTLQFVVAGVPVQKGSMRAFARVIPGKFNKRGQPVAVATVTADNKAELRSWQHAIGAEAARAGARVLEGGVAVRVTFDFVRPASVSAKARPFHTVKPDLDKLVRAVLDGLTGVAFRDDAQVNKVTALKRYGDRAQCLVELEEAPRG